MYYHVLVEIKGKIGKSNQNKEITVLDMKSRDDVLNDIVIPYLNNIQFPFNGYILNKQIINRLKIMTTEKTVNSLSQYENDNMPSGIIMYVSPNDILEYDKYVTDVTKELFDEGKKKKHLVLDIEKDKNKVFIVHGRDNETKQEVARFVENNGFEPIILHEQPSSGMTIIEKIEKYTNVGFGIVLYTPCDKGHEKDSPEKIKSRARQNVVFEHGFLISKLGRNNVCALVKGDIEKPNDISGVVYIDFDSNGGWKIPLLKEMKSSRNEKF
ncbi:MAG: nucleotide-binding protein [Lagierella massiliensis]|nr:nucleotide-binding protein [Lagierella massiliensis]